MPGLPPPDETTTTKKIPRVTLPEIITDAFESSPGSISPDIAAVLAKSLIGHVLFLKGQIVLPVGQLTKMVQRQEQMKAASAGKGNAKASKAQKLLEAYELLSTHLASTFQALAWAYAKDGREHGDAHLAMLVGPGLSSAKAKVMLAVHGLDIPLPSTSTPADDEEEEDEGEEVLEGEDATSEGSDVDDIEGSDAEGLEEGFEEGTEEEEEVDEEADNEALVRHAAEQKAIHAADRLLSMTLARTEADGIAMGEDIAPTQTHVLLRCPRTFDHAAWTPQPNFTPSLNKILHDFHDACQHSTDPDASPASTKSLKKAKKLVQGVIITTPHNAESVEQPSDREDDMLWYAWNGGKLVGFSDW